MASARYAYVAAVVVGAGTLTAQESVRQGELTPPSGAGVPANSAVTLFDRSRNTFNWGGRIGLDTTAWGTRIRFRGMTSANIILLEASGPAPAQRLTSLQRTVGMRVARPLLSSLDVLADISTLSYTDDKDVGLSSASTTIVAGGLGFAPAPGVSIAPLAGFRWDDQGTLRDRGVHYGLSAAARSLMIDGYRLNADVRLQEDRLDPRMLENHGVRAGVERSFEGRARDSLDIAVTRTRSEFYAPPDTLRGVDSRIENLLTVANLLDYDLGASLLASLYVNVSTRGLQRDSRRAGALPVPVVFGSAIDEFRLETYLQTAFGEGGGGAGGFLRLYYGERTENHEARLPADAAGDLRPQFDERNAQERTKNNGTRRTIATGAADWPLGESDTLHVAGAAGILRYDTPSRENTEDRDEQLFALTVASAHRLTSTLLLTVTLEGTMGHTVYLLGERSGNNNRNRVLRLSPRMVYRPGPGFLTANAFEVLANYTVYDFEQEAALARSYSYRQFAWHDSTAVEVTDRIGLDFLGSLKFYERGQLNWGEFTERTENAYTDGMLSLQARWSPVRGTTLAAGYRSFTQWRYSFSGGRKTRDALIERRGPTCAFQWDAHTLGSITLLGWYERWRQSTGGSGAIANLSMTVQLNF